MYAVILKFLPLISGLFVGWRLWLIIGSVGGVFFLYWSGVQYEKGYNSCINKIEAQAEEKQKEIKNAKNTGIKKANDCLISNSILNCMRKQAEDNGNNKWWNFSSFPEH